MSIWKRGPDPKGSASEPVPEAAAMERQRDLEEPLGRDLQRGVAEPEEDIPARRPSTGADDSLGWTRSSLWRQVGAVPIILVGLAAGVGVVLSRHIANVDVGRIDRFQAAARESPRARRTEVNNEIIAATKPVADLDGMVIRYPEEVAALVTPDGSFRTDLSLEDMAGVLRIDPRVIGQKDCPNKINSGAVLFKVVIGTLSERSKSFLRAERTTTRRVNRPPDMLVDEFVIAELSFSLDALVQPDADRRMILAAISRSARELRPQPGERARAIATSREEIESGPDDFMPGYLPLEASLGALILNNPQNFPEPR